MSTMLIAGVFNFCVQVRASGCGDLIDSLLKEVADFVNFFTRKIKTAT